MRKSTTRRDAARWAVVGAMAVAALAAGPATARAQEVPVVRFHVGGEELAPVAYPERYRSASDVEADVEWTRSHSRDLREWWAERGPLYLRRVTDLAGLAWEVDAVDVYLVRYWPVVSIERPLVLALDAIRSSGGVVDLPDDEDLRVLLLAHQVVHYLLDPDQPTARDRVYDHPFLEPGDFALESMVNWLTYEALTDLWGADRLRRATDTDLWRGYNPNHAFVTEELRPTWRLSRTRPLRVWLEQHPEGSDVFDLAERYEREAVGVPRRDEERVVPREGATGTDYGVDLGADYEGRIVVAYVDEASPAARAGLRQGDLLSTIEGRSVDGLDDAGRRLRESWRENEEINLSVLRDGREVYLTIGR